MKRFLLFYVFISLALAGYSQERKYAVKTDTEAGRWEIVQSPILRKCTIKLDKYTGKTYQLVTTSNDNVTWEEILWIGDAASNRKENRINYQIFMGGIMARDCFLINIHTGETWILNVVDTSSERIVWETIVEE